MNSKQAPIRQFIRRACAFLVLQVLVAAIVIRFGSPEHSNHYLGAIQDKIARLKQCEGRRLVVLGGSNVAFGIHSPVMQESLGLQTVNLGLHVSLGLTFPMECYLQHSHPGDIVILCPEYHLLTSDQHQQGDPTTIDQMLEQWPDARRYLEGMDKTTWKQFLDHEALWIAHQWVGRAFRNVRARDRSDKVYSRSSFNEFGDVIVHHGREADQLMPMSPVPESTPELIEQTVAVLNQFYQACREKGVTVYLSYPPFSETCYRESKDAIEQVHLALAERIEIPILNTPDAFVFDERCFFDSAYHLNQETGAARTRAIAEAVGQHLRGDRRVAMQGGVTLR